jgi:hypothetical protein
MLVLELQRVGREVEKLVLEQRNICFQLHAMKKGGGMSFQPTPIIHLKKPTNDGGRCVIIVQPCGYCNQCFHCFDIAVTSCKHLFHPLCFGAMLQNSNKCCVCKQKLRPN